MNWSSLHAESEALAIQAQSALRNKDVAGSKELYRQAGEKEQAALLHLECSKVRTRGITAISAVALWYKAGEYNLAEALAYSMLSEKGLPEFARSQLRLLVQAIWTEDTKRKANVDFLPGQVAVSIKGGDIVPGGAPLDLVVDKVKTIQSMFVRTIELFRDIPHRRHGPPSRDIQEACTPWLFQSAPGSYQFCVAIQRPAQGDFFRPEVEPELIAQHFLRIVEASGNGDAEEFQKLVPDKAYRRTFLELSRNLSPTGKTFERLELRTDGEVRPVALDVTSRDNANRELRKAKSPPDQISVELRGILRAVDLNKDWLDLTSEGGVIHIIELQDTVDDVIGPLVNRTVVVHAIKTGEKFKFLDIEAVE